MAGAAPPPAGVELQVKLGESFRNPKRVAYNTLQYSFKGGRSGSSGTLQRSADGRISFEFVPAVPSAGADPLRPVDCFRATLGGRGHSSAAVGGVPASTEFVLVYEDGACRLERVSGSAKGLKAQSKRSRSGQPQQQPQEQLPHAHPLIAGGSSTSGYSNWQPSIAAAGSSSDDDDSDSASE